MYACLQKQVTYVATVFNTTKNLGDDTCVNKSIDYSSGKTSNVFKDTTHISCEVSGMCKCIALNLVSPLPGFSCSLQDLLVAFKQSYMHPYN